MRSRARGSATCRRRATSFRRSPSEEPRCSGFKQVRQIGALVDRGHLRAVFPCCASAPRRPAGALSGGEQQMLTICRTMMGDPDLVLIDEPTEGLSPMMASQGRRTARGDRPPRRRGPAGRTEARAGPEDQPALYVMGHGRIVFEGSPKCLWRTPRFARPGWRCEGGEARPGRLAAGPRLFPTPQALEPAAIWRTRLQRHPRALDSATRRRALVIEPRDLRYMGSFAP